MKKLVFLLMIFVMFLPIVCAVEINEIMYNPEGDDYAYEFLEVYFDELIDVSGWYFEGINFEFGEGVDGGGYLVIANNCTSFEERYDLGCEFEYKGTLNNDGELISLFDSEGNLINQIEYFPDWGASTRGSLEKIDDEWLESEEDYGSPSEENSQGIQDDEDIYGEENGEDSDNDSRDDSPTRNDLEIIDVGDSKIDSEKLEPIVLEMGEKNNQSKETWEIKSYEKSSKKYGWYILVGILIVLMIYLIFKKK